MDKKIKETKQIKGLVKRFEENISQYKRADYDEANTRADFIDPFFENMGWDVSNKQGYAEQYREVVREAKLIIAGKHKAPDYSFRIGGIRKFFVEAKKPSVVLKSEVSPAYQIRRYAYTAKLPLSILTDFEEFSVYDTRIKPTPKDSASCARIFYCGYKDYLKNFDFIYDIFSKEGILRGSFDRYIESTRNKRGTSEVDKEFLKLIDMWREKLAKNIALRNKRLSLYELNFAVQKIVDRIIFLRISEDRQIEDYGKLQILLNGTNTYRRLMQIFLHSDKKYNSGLFDFEKDGITPNLSVDDKVIKDILKSVYYPESPYEFSVLDVEILGNIYEQFLGKTIRLTPAHQVKIEEKPEVKKAGGVYYTPKYIVDYIVRNSIGEIIKGKTPKQIDRLKLIDPACGSGSFLLGAYQELLNYHLDWYFRNENQKKALKKGQIIETGKDSFQLTIAEKQRILLNNIFGVDIDTQAVEVSKLSLLLKLLEGETEESTRQLFRYTEKKILPDLSDNIKCGNSLIGPDFYDTQQTTLFDETEMRRINVFDWKSAFPDIFQNGGFDVVIGNPPYGALLTSLGREYLERNFKLGNTDTAALFMVKAGQLLCEGGYNGFIVPKPFIYASNWVKTRSRLLSDLVGIVDVGKVWKEVKLEQVIYISRRGKKARDYTTAKRENKNIIPLGKINKINCELFGFILSGVSNKELKIALKLEKNRSLNDFVANQRGESVQKFVKKERDNYQVLGGKQINRYFVNGIKGYIAKEHIKSDKAFIKQNSLLVQRIVAHLTRPKPHIKIIGCISDEIDQSNTVIVDTINQLTNKSQLSTRYILALLHSILINWYVYRFIEAKAIRTMQFDNPLTQRLPIRTIDFSNPSEKAMHDKLVSMVNKMLELQKRFHSVRLENDKEMYKTQIDVLNNQIDSLVYELYGLTEEEINIIKSGS